MLLQHRGLVLELRDMKRCAATPGGGVRGVNNHIADIDTLADIDDY